VDTLTHALSGALLGRATAPARPGPADLSNSARVVAGFLAGAFPDTDVVLSLVSPVAYLTLHRGPTHSLLLAPFWALLLAWMFSLFSRAQGWRAFYGVALGALLIHIAGDWITSFGTLMLWPLSDHRFALSTTFIIDLWFTGILVAGLAASALWRQSRAPAVAGLAVLAGYVALQGYAHHQALEIGRAQGGPNAVVTALPRPASPFNWMVIVAEDDRYRYASVRTVSGAPLLASLSPWVGRLAAPYVPAAQAVWDVAYRFGPDGDTRAVAEAAWHAPGLAFFRWFAEAPLAVDVRRGNPSTCVWFQDLRFLTPGRDQWPFRYGACRSDGAGEWRAYEWNDGAPRPLDLG
jgi:inner membrane protein